jgi:cysteine desulfuration protein SufE
LDTLAADMELVPDPRERLAALVRWGQHAPELPASEHADALRVAGCISRVWLDARIADGVMHIRLAADSPMVRGLAGITARLADGHPAAVLAVADLNWPRRLGLDREITPTRLHGLAAVANRILQLASSP